MRSIEIIVLIILFFLLNYFFRFAFQSLFYRHAQLTEKKQSWVEIYWGSLFQNVATFVVGLQ